MSEPQPRRPSSPLERWKNPRGRTKPRRPSHHSQRGPSGSSGAAGDSSKPSRSSTSVLIPTFEQLKSNESLTNAHSEYCLEPKSSTQSHLTCHGEYRNREKIDEFASVCDRSVVDWDRHLRAIQAVASGVTRTFNGPDTAPGDEGSAENMSRATYEALAMGIHVANNHVTHLQSAHAQEWLSRASTVIPAVSLTHATGAEEVQALHDIRQLMLDSKSILLRKYDAYQGELSATKESDAVEDPDSRSAGMIDKDMMALSELTEGFPDKKFTVEYSDDEG